MTASNSEGSMRRVEERQRDRAETTARLFSTAIYYIHIFPFLLPFPSFSFSFSFSFIFLLFSISLLFVRVYRHLDHRLLPRSHTRVFSQTFRCPGSLSRCLHMLASVCCLLLASPAFATSPACTQTLQALVAVPVLRQRLFQPNAPKMELSLLSVAASHTPLHYSPIDTDTRRCRTQSSAQSHPQSRTHSIAIAVTRTSPYDIFWQ